MNRNNKLMLKKICILTVVFAMAAVFYFLIPVDIVKSQVGIVSVPQDYPTIQQAIDSVYGSFDNPITIYVAAGTYNESIIAKVIFLMNFFVLSTGIGHFNPFASKL